MFDLIIIGAGPAGIAAAFEAKKAGLKYLVLEKGLIGNTIYQYPVGLTVFSTTDELEFEEGKLKPAREKPTREELLSYYVRFVLDNDLNVLTEEKVVNVTRAENHPVAETATPLLRKEGNSELKDIMVMGGGELGSALLDAGVVDEIGFNIQPVLLGSGIPVWHRMSQVDLELIECRGLKKGCVYVTYKVSN